MDYSQIADNEIAAFTAFKEVYAVRNPLPPKPQLDQESRWLQWLFYGLALSAIGGSAAHTIPMFARGVDSPHPEIRYGVGVLGFVMVELGIVLLTFTITRRHFRYEKTSNPARTSLFMMAALGLVLIVALAVNVYSVVAPLWNEAEPLTTDIENTQVDYVYTAAIESQDAPSKFEIALWTLIGLSAPTMVYFVGEALGLAHVENWRALQVQQRAYDESLASWHDGLQRSWQASRGRVNWKGEGVQSSSGQSGHGKGYQRKSAAWEKVETHLRANPDDINRNVRELAGVLGVGKSTVSSVQMEFRARK